MNVNEAIVSIYQQTKIKPSYADIGKTLNLGRQTISKRVKRGVEFSEEELTKLEENYKAKLKEVDNVASKIVNQDDCVFLPCVTASAGGGYSVIESEQIAVSKAELIDIGFKKFDNLVIVKISGKSMQPTINDGDILILDTKTENILDNGIYVLNYGGELYCKRILKGLTYVKLKSDNPEYDPEKIEGQERDKLNIIGKVVYRMNKF